METKTDSPLQAVADWLYSLPAEFYRPFLFLLYRSRFLHGYFATEPLNNVPAPMQQEQADQEFKSFFSTKGLEGYQIMQRIFLIRSLISFHLDGMGTQAAWVSSSEKLELVKRHLLAEGGFKDVSQMQFLQDLIENLPDTARRWMPIAESWHELLGGALSDRALNQWYETTGLALNRF